MNSSVSGFARNAEVAAARADRAFNKMLPSFGSKTNEVIDYAKGIVGVQSAIEAIKFSATSILDYEDAVLSFRTIVSDLTDNEFAAYEKQIGIVADITKKSSVDIAKSFEVIAGLNAEFANTAEGLGMVTQSVSTLAKASRMDMGAAAESLIGIMNQFNYSVEQSDRVINVLAAGQAVGAASINQTADALTNFGAVAKGANITIEQSTGLIQLLASKGQLGAEAGSRLRAAIVKLQAAGVGYASGVFNINDALTELKGQYDALRTPMERDAMLSKSFGLESITTGSILLNNIDAFKNFTTAVTGTSEAQKAAEINSKSLRAKLGELVNTFVTAISTADNTKGGIGLLSGAIGWLTDNMGWLLDIAVPLIGVLLTVKGAILGMALVAKLAALRMWALEFVAGVATAANGVYATSCFATEAGMYGMATASFFLETSLLGLVGVTVAVVAALATLTAGFINGYDASVDYVGQLKKAKDGFYELAKPLTEAQIALQLYNKEMEHFRELQNYAASIDYRLEKGGAMNYLSLVYDQFRHFGMSQELRLKTQNGLIPLMAPTPQQFGIKRDTSEALPPISNRATEQNTLYERIQESSKKEKIELSYNNMPSNVNVSATAGIAVKGTTTMMGGNL
jgi:TP901 family phage tail tape measure protein